MVKKLCILFLLTLTFGPLLAQYGLSPNEKPSRDYIIFKKRYKTIRNYFAGSYITFQLNNGQWQEGTITRIAHDSMWMKQQQIQLVGKGFGSEIDTVTFGYNKLAIADIVAMPRPKESWSFIKNGTLFKLAGGAYIALNVINGFGKGADPLFGSRNLPKLITAASVYAVGTALGLLYKPYARIAKKYRIQYVQL
jgi:hypothetical protein